MTRSGIIFAAKLCACAGVALTLSGCFGLFDEYTITGNRPPPPPTPEQQRQWAEEQKEAMRPRISVSYYAPTFVTDVDGQEIVYALKKITWSMSFKNEDHVYLFSLKPDGSGHREICCLDSRDERHFWELLWPPFDHMEISLPANLGVLGSEWSLGTEHILVFSLDSRVNHRLSPQSWETELRPHKVACPTISSDGRWVAFVENVWIKGGDYWRIVKCRSDGSDYTVLTQFDHYRNDMQPAWSPDGNLIAYIRPNNDELRVMDVNGNIKWTFHSFQPRNPRWSPDGKFLLLNGEIVVDVATRKVIRKLNPPLSEWARWGRAGYLVPQKDGVDFVELDGKTTHRLLQNVSRLAKRSDISKEEFRW